ncbi:putative trypsin-6 isoform X2 [Drosophila bipectinata]|uniref:putative trypsin-6 isoform X2 n=1 Tax=Drosophila bipectinata TaxID=42026 RepID=UPI0038B328DB
MSLSKFFVYFFLLFMHIDVVLLVIPSVCFPSEFSSQLTSNGDNGTSSSEWRSLNKRNEEVEKQTDEFQENGNDFDSFEIEYLVTGGYRPKNNNLIKFTVSLRYNKIKQFFGDNHFCGGAIIHRKCVITSAHCLFTKKGRLEKADYVTVVAGTPNRLERISSTQVVKAKKLIPHPDYNREMGHKFDIGLVLLNTDLVLGPSVAVILLTDIPPAKNLDCTVVGWGQFGPFPDGAVNVDIKVLSKTLCENMPKWNPDGMICGGDPKFFEVDSCYGDSGGPLYCGLKLYGTVSYGRGCGTPGYYGVYTDVYFFRDWLEPATRGVWPEIDGGSSPIFFRSFKGEVSQYLASLFLYYFLKLPLTAWE